MGGAKDIEGRVGEREMKDKQELKNQRKEKYRGSYFFTRRSTERKSRKAPKRCVFDDENEQ